MSFTEFLNNSTPIDDSLICGKILLHTKEWEISFSCDFCQRNLSTLPELLRHAINQHMENVPREKLQELFRFVGECYPEEKIEYREVIEQYLPYLKESEKNESQPIELVRTEEFVSDVKEDLEGKLEANCENHLNRSHLTKHDQTEYIQNSEYEVSNICCDDDDVNSIENENNDFVNEQFEFLDVKNENTTVGSPVKITKEKTSRLICKVCSEKFSTRSQLAEHRNKHGNKPYICQQCGASFAEKGNFKEHYRRHLGIKPHACTMCERAFTSTTELKIHLRTHTGERPYKCSICDRRFARSGEMTAHERRHNNVRPYLCPNCGKTFLEAKNLNNHLATHSIERTHECQDCDAKFSTLNGLRQHWQVHSSEKKYRCQFCRKQFAKTRGLRMHMKRAHTIET